MVNHGKDKGVIMADRVGQQLGNYRLVRLLGEGGFADVYQGEHIHLGTQAAIKVLQMPLLDKKNIDAFHVEARTIAHLSHPHIIRVFDYGVQDWAPFLVMDYAPGGTLRQRFTGKPAGLAGLFPYVTQIASALQYAHDRNLIHRDVKPENMLLGVNGEIFLSDFGFAMVVQNFDTRNTRDTSGTAVYMAPEQLEGKPCAASDQYALGLVVYEWLSGTRPFHGTFQEVVQQQILMPIQPLSYKVPDLPQGIEQIVMKALARNPAERFGNVKEFAQTLLLTYQASRRKRTTGQYAGVSLSGVPRPGWLPPANEVFPAQPPADGPSSSVSRPANGVAPAPVEKPSWIKGATSPSLPGISSSPSRQGMSSPSWSGISSMSGPVSQSFSIPSRPSVTKSSSPSLPSFTNPALSHGEQSPAGGPPSLPSMPSIPSQSRKRPLGPTSLHGLSDSASQSMPGPSMPSPSSSSMPAMGSTGSFPSMASQVSQGRLPVMPTTPPRQSTQNSLPAMPAMPSQSTQNRLSAMPRNTTGDFSSFMPSRPFPALQTQQKQIPSISHIPTSPQMPMSSGVHNGAFASPAAKRVSDEEELKQLYVELDQIKTSQARTGPQSRLRGHSSFNKTLFWVISIFVVVLVIGASTSIFYLANANKGNNASTMQATTSTNNVQTAATQLVKPTATKSQPPATPTPIANPYPPNNGVLAVNDPLTKNNYKWQEYTDAQTGDSCQFINGAYHVISAGGSASAGTCFAQDTDFTNFTYQVQMMVQSAGTKFSGGGIVFRGNSQTGVYYYFEIYKSGRYDFMACFGPGKANCTVTISGYPKQAFSIPTFNPALNQTNTLAVVAHNTAFDFYVNGQHVLGPIYDGNFTHGMVGVYATGGIDAGATEKADVVFSNARVWRQ
jgi:serine/threonine protein kinase